MTSSGVACKPVSSKCLRAASQLSCHAYSRSCCSMSWLIASVASAWGLRFCLRAMALSFFRAVTSIRIDMGTVVEVIDAPFEKLPRRRWHKTVLQRIRALKRQHQRQRCAGAWLFGQQRKPAPHGYCIGCCRGACLCARCPRPWRVSAQGANRFHRAAGVRLAKFCSNCAASNPIHLDRVQFGWGLCTQGCGQ